MSEHKTHYRKVFKSDHLGQADLEDFSEEGKKLIFTIKHVRQEYGTKVAGHKIDANICYFVESIKPWVVNAGNSAILKQFAGSPFVEDWSDTKIELYIDANVKMKGEVVGGVRIKPIQPKAKVKIAFTEAHFKSAKAANATIETIKNSYTITEEIENKYTVYGHGAA